MWPSSRAKNERRAEDDPWGVARATAEDFLTGRISGQQFVTELHVIGDGGPEELQDLVELDDQYDQAIDMRADEKFCSDRIMELLVRRARELAADS